MLAVDVQTVALAIGRMRAADVRAFVPVETQPLQVFEQLAFKARFAALQVSVLDAQDHAFRRYGARTAS